MLVLGHIGITLGAGLIARYGSICADSRRRSSKDGLKPRWQECLPLRFFHDMDFRLLLFGAILPDIIDKFLGLYLLVDALSNGRVFAHTLIFFIIMVMGGFILYRKKGRMALLVVAAGVLVHIIEDRMWQMPQTLFWPAFGWVFPKLDLTDWTQNTVFRLFHDPTIYIPELLGLLIILAFTGYLAFQHRLLVFIKTGRMDPVKMGAPPSPQILNEDLCSGLH